MKSYYSIMLFILFTIAMDVMAVCSTIMSKQDLSPADAAIVSLTVLAIMLAHRLSQAEKRIAHLENEIEKMPAPIKKNEKTKVSSNSLKNPDSVNSADNKEDKHPE